ncbi:MAG: hypothetical protein QF486_05385 [Candidatus Woesearchaeota archaeon]|nr:hypothetical protein [Candidatus Woesearchaeota archaeon]MDP7199021.1 hypothetical protein [Candidatus Woesearchaeota archaeon]MDP7467725.1 hypothetical protein [Candidatus Woesearchaeota archaeon]MDP7646809.1 hypothetical protein [Candidatus Woesearchaeota archaeon]
MRRFIVLFLVALIGCVTVNMGPAEQVPCLRLACGEGERCLENNGAGQCIPYVCETLGGKLCKPTEKCPGSNPVQGEPCCSVDCVDSGIDLCQDMTCARNTKCVDGECLLKTCTEIGGEACKEFRACSIIPVLSSDSKFCCLEPCLNLESCDTKDDCDDGKASTNDICVTATKLCQHLPITTCQHGDGYCTPGCTVENDHDCGPEVTCRTDADCDSGVVRTKFCEGRYEGRECTSNCRCVSLLQDECQDDDRICPVDCNEYNDNDCEDDPEIQLVEPFIIGDEYENQNVSCRTRWWLFFGTNSTYEEQVEVRYEFYVDSLLVRQKDYTIHPGINDVVIEVGRQDLNHTFVRLLMVGKSVAIRGNDHFSQNLEQFCTPRNSTTQA